MSYKKLYFENRNLDLSKYKRDYFGSREIDTIKFIFKNFYDHVISENAYILDLGSGDNFLKSTILKNNWNYKSLDIDNLNFEKDKFMFENNTFDVIISLAVIEHLDDPSIFLREIYRVLKNNGILFLSTPNWHYSKENFYDDFTHKKPYTPKSISNLLKIYKFSNIQTFPNLRCKSKWWYKGKYKFFKARYFLPFDGDVKFIPELLKGKSKGIFAVAKKLA